MITKEMLQNCIENIDYCIKHTKQRDSNTTPDKRGFMLLLNGNELTEKPSLGELAKYLDVPYNAIAKLRQKRITTLSKQGYSVEKINLDGTINKKH